MKTAIVGLIALALLCPMAPAQTADIDDLLARVEKWDFDKNRDDVLAVSALVVSAQASPAQLRGIEKRFIAFLKSDASFAGKDFVCRELSVMGSEASVPVLSEMLSDVKTADMARYALERIPGPVVDQALRRVLAKSSDRTRIGIINTLGRRRDAGSVPALRPLASGTDQATAAAALFALAEIADQAAIRALGEAHAKSSGALHVTASEAYLRAADRLTAPTALPIYKKLYDASEPFMVRVGALNGIARTGDAQSVAVLITALRGNDVRLQAAAIRALAPASTKRLIAELPTVSEAGQVRILGVLAERREASALPAFMAVLKGTNKPARLAALEGLCQVGNASIVPELARIAAGTEQSEQAAARLSLARMPGKTVDQAVADGIASAEPNVRVELIRAAGERGTTAAVPVLMKMARDANDDVRRESLRALRTTGSANEISGLVALVTNPAKLDDRAEAVRSLSMVLRRSDPSRLSDVLSVYESATDVEARTALIQVLGQAGTLPALPVLREALKSQDTEIKRAAILALSDWPDGAPISDMLETARTASSAAHQVLALRGALKLIALPAAGRQHRESVKLLAEAMSLAKQPEEKRSVLSLLPRFPVKEALDLAKASLEDNDVQAEAQMAVNRLARVVKQQTESPPMN
jgi:HEAT repeat protein